MIRRLLQRLKDWATALPNRLRDVLIAWLAGDGTTWLTDEYLALLDEQDQGGEGR
jgi:hypothetical protein